MSEATSRRGDEPNIRRYNAAHRGAEREVFPAAAARGLPVVAYPALRWGALLRPSAAPRLGPLRTCWRFSRACPTGSRCATRPVAGTATTTTSCVRWRRAYWWPTHDEANFTADPQNALVWRQSKRRLDTECIRDAMLTASDQLDPKPPVGSALAVSGDGPIGSTGGFIRINEDTFLNVTADYRSVYLPIVRDLLPDALAVFDHPDASHVCGGREVTNVPAQALYLLNNEFVAAQARKFADRLLAMPSATTN